MKKPIHVFSSLFIITLLQSAVAYNVYIDDGGYHTVDDNQYVTNTVILDFSYPYIPGTHLELVGGGELSSLTLRNNSTVGVSGGVIHSQVSTYDNSTIDLSDGYILSVDVYNNSTFNISGGLFSRIFAFDNASVALSGGGIYELGDLVMNENSTFNMSDGDIWEVYMKQNSYSSISGGNIQNLRTRDDSTAILTGGTFRGSIQIWDNSTVDLIDGLLKYDLLVYDDAIATVKGGTIEEHIEIYDNSTVLMSGGIVDGRLAAYHDSTITISGGSIRQIIAAGQNGTIYLAGRDFEVDGHLLSYGDKLSDFGTLVPNSNEDYYTGTVTGTLLDGSTLNNTFRIFNLEGNAGTGDIIIIPEPGTLLLLGLGGLLIRRR